MDTTEKEKLDRALRRIDRALNTWGLDTYLGYRTDHTLRMSAGGASNLERLIDEMTDELARLTAKVERLETSTK